MMESAISNDSGPGTIISKYEEQFSVLNARIVDKISRLGQLATPSHRFSECQAAERLFEEAKDVLDQIEMEIRSITDPTSRARFEKRLTAYRSELAKLEANLRQSVTPSDQVLFSRGSAVTDAEMSNTDLIKRAGDRLDNGYRVCMETEEAGRGVLSDLHAQHESLLQSRGRLRNLDDNLGSGSRILNSMILAVTQNKLALWGILLLVFASIVTAAYFIARKHS